jgi:predicted esterase
LNGWSSQKRGYIVVAPAAPDGDLFFEEGERIFPEFLKMIMADHKIQDDKFHVAGTSNGGIAALHIAAFNPQYFLSVTSFPGFMWQPRAAKLRAISEMCVFMYVGEFDPYRWHGGMQWEAEYLRSQGTLARYTREGAAASTGHAGGRQCWALVRRVRGDQEWSPIVVAPRLN